jgi:predicted metal-dependent enzyme (double-stranded beta helix superfamily)
MLFLVVLSTTDGEKSMFDLQQFVKECQSALDDPKPTQRVEALIKEAISHPNSVRAAFAEASNVEHQGPISFAWRDANLSVADVTSPPGLRTPAHDHNMWAVIGVYDGQEFNRFYRYEDGVLHEKGERLLKEGDVVVLGSEVVHAIANPLPVNSSAIHVYGGDLVTRSNRSMWNPQTEKREDYDITQLIAYVTEMSVSE